MTDSNLPSPTPNKPGSEDDLFKARTQEEEEVIASFFTSISKKSPLVPMSLNQEYIIPPEDNILERQQFWIRLADTKERREQAGLLVDRMYAWRGFTHENIIRETPHTITLISYGRDGRVIGTITIGMDSPEEKLLAEENYPIEISDLRSKGKKIAEFNALAVDPEIRSKLVIARLFHIAMMYPYGLFNYTDAVIEVNPSHVRFYERLLQFDKLGDEKTCSRVNAPSILLHIEFSAAAEKLERVGGLLENASGDHSLYPYGFNHQDAKGILERLKRMQFQSENP